MSPGLRARLATVGRPAEYWGSAQRGLDVDMESPASRNAAPSALDRYLAVRDQLTFDLFGGPRVSFHHVVNLQKGATLPFVLLLMWARDCWTPTAWVYLALHGSYGLVWLLKETLFPDPAWRRPATFAGAFNAWLWVLGPYWIAPWLIVTQRIEQPPALLAGAIALYVVGLALMIGADAQKYFVLRARPGLIVDGFFARTRNPNYLGEMMLYAAFALVAGHWLPWLALVWVWTAVFLPNMLRKDRRMARHPGWREYRARTWMLWPKLGAS